LKISTQLRKFLDKTLGPMDSEAELASAEDEGVVMFIARIELDDDIPYAHLRRVHRRIQDLLQEEFGLEEFDDAEHPDA
jgi:fido (protein-threonine AMPylation protein)